MATITHVQGNSSNTTSGSSCACTLSSTVGIGNTIVGFIAWAGSQTITALYDNAGNNYTIVDTVSQTNTLLYNLTSFYLTKIENAPNTVTVQFSGSPNGIDVLIDEYSGIASLDKHTAQTQPSVGTGTNAVTSGSVTTTANNDLVYGGTFHAGTGAATAAVGTGFTLRQSTNFGSARIAYTEDLTLATAGSTAATFTSSASSSTWNTGVMAFLAQTGTAYLMSATQGAYTLTGRSVVFCAARKITATSGTYTLTGFGAIVGKGYHLVAATGIYTLTGISAAFHVARKIIAATGTYTLTGFGAIVGKGYHLVAATGIYSIIGQAVSLIATPIVHQFIRSTNYILQEIRVVNQNLTLAPNKVSYILGYIRQQLSKLNQ